MKIIIDARMYGLEHAGIGRYLVNLIDQIEKQDNKNEYLVLLREKYFHELSFKNKNFQKILADYQHYSFKEQIALIIQLIKLKPDLIHFPHFNVPLLYFGKYVVTIHDLIKHESRGTMTSTRFPLIYWLKFFVYRLVAWATIKKAVKIITPSYFWQKELIKRFRLPKEKIVVTYEGFDENLLLKKSKISPQNILAKYKIKKPFVVYTGSLYPHKNVEILVKAVGKTNQGLSLVIVCARNIFYERFLAKIEKMGFSKSVNLVGFVPDEEIAGLYSQAEAFVFPSLWEGFGLPGLEAMALELPLLSAKASCLPEVYGQAALYFDPYNLDDLMEKIEKIGKDKKLREGLIKKGLVQVRKYSWEKMGKETLKVYEDSAGLRSS
jgi:glycosyltransferase involved in cell wall biosynthesis